VEQQEECIEKGFDFHSNTITKSEDNLNSESSSTLTKLINKHDAINGPASAVAHL